MLPRSTSFPAFLIFSLLACTARSEGIKRMEHFDSKLFYSRYHGKEPVVIQNTDGLRSATTDIFQTCKDDIVYLTRLPTMEEDLAEVSLTNAFAPCGADCYGVHEAKVCAEVILDLPEGFGEEVWFSIVQKGMETPAVLFEDDYYRYISAGVEDWRLLTGFEDETIDLFTQKPYAEKLVTGDLLYVPPGTLAQHSALTTLSVAVGSS